MRYGRTVNPTESPEPAGADIVHRLSTRGFFHARVLPWFLTSLLKSHP